MVVPLLLCNNLPSVADNSKGLSRRLVVVPFEREFTAEEKKNTPFPDIWKHEMSGILNEALKAFPGVRKRGWFKVPKHVEQARNNWLDSANPLRTFIAEECMRQGRNKILVSDLYRRYTEWTVRAGVAYPLQRNTFKRHLEQLGYEIKHTNRGSAIIGLRYHGSC